MPLYEYECEECGSVFEVMQKFSDQPLTVHENCGGKVRRLLSPPALRFKGSGWYITDYAKGANGRRGASSSDSVKPDSSKSEAKSESKPAPAPAKSD